MEYGNIARVYARLVKEGKRTLDSIKNIIVREAVQKILDEEESQSE